MNDLCSAIGCAKPARARGLCWAHYKRLSRAGVLSPRPDAEERFWSFVDRSGDCWKWNGFLRSRDREYGGFKLDGRTVAAHRYAYEIHHGPIPAGLHIDHLCRNKLCVNPAHLEPVPPAENTRRAKALQTHCENGHPFDARTAAQRICRTCRREVGRRHSERKKARS